MKAPEYTTRPVISAENSTESRSGACQTPFTSWGTLQRIPSPRPECTAPTWPAPPPAPAGPRCRWAGRGTPRSTRTAVQQQGDVAHHLHVGPHQGPQQPVAAEGGHARQGASRVAPTRPVSTGPQVFHQPRQQAPPVVHGGRRAAAIRRCRSWRLAQPAPGEQHPGGAEVAHQVRQQEGDQQQHHQATVPWTIQGTTRRSRHQATVPSRGGASAEGGE